MDITLHDTVSYIIYIYHYKHSHEHADNDKDVPQGNEDPEVSQALQEFADPVSNGRLLLTLVKGVWCPLLPEGNHREVDLYETPQYARAV